ncbi:MAG TPA: hypothetical protein VFB62_03020 [Polyangiaceae bacterium]|jgi:peptidoglycan/LPS O-acetylase OafA/YrhL|nr:hypothetical protein [Polyangiaceae bacterium]
MIAFEILTWAMLGALVAAFQVFVGEEDEHPWRYLIPSCIAAMIGGAFTRFSAANNWFIGSYSVSSLLVAGFFAVATVALIVTVAHPRLHPRS